MMKYFISIKDLVNLKRSEEVDSPFEFINFVFLDLFPQNNFFLFDIKVLGRLSDLKIHLIFLQFN